MRWFKELLRPKLKCARLGHVSGYREVREGYTNDTKGFRAVADEIVQSRPICQRCSEPQGEWSDDYRSGINSLTLDKDKYRILDQEGAIWFSTRTERAKPQEGEA
jgi:hypothetical protein